MHKFEKFGVFSEYLRNMHQCIKCNTLIEIDDIQCFPHPFEFRRIALKKRVLSHKLYYAPKTEILC